MCTVLGAVCHPDSQSGTALTREREVRAISMDLVFLVAVVEVSASADGPANLYRDEQSPPPIALSSCNRAGLNIRVSRAGQG